MDDVYEHVYTQDERDDREDRLERLRIEREKEVEAFEFRKKEILALEEIACIPEFLGYLTDEIKKLRLALLQQKGS